MTAVRMVAAPGFVSTVLASPVLASPVLASPESTGRTGIKFVAVLVGLALIYLAIRAMFGRRR